MKRTVTTENVKKLREITGLGMIECKELLEKFDTTEEIIEYVRKTSDEPWKKGLTEPRVDVLKNNEVMATFKTLDKAYKAGYSSLFYRIRVVSELGRYVYVK